MSNSVGYFFLYFLRQLRKIHNLVEKKEEEGKREEKKKEDGLKKEETKIGVVDRELLRRYVRSAAATATAPSPDSPAVLYLPLGILFF